MLEIFKIMTDVKLKLNLVKFFDYLLNFDVIGI